ncbi:hypothetical protein [Sporomusa malonica]|nr:hypothetical protein [Sporomusa malonica]
MHTLITRGSMAATSRGSAACLVRTDRRRDLFSRQKKGYFAGCVE